MKIKGIILCGLIILLAGSISLYSQEGREREVVQTDFYFAPLPSFNEMFSALDYLEIKDYDTALEAGIYKVEEEVYKVAFALGVNTADAIMATKGRNNEKLNEIAQLMISYAKFLGLSEEILRLGDELHTLIRRNQWDDLLLSLERYREEVEIALYESRQYDLFTMMQLGGWTQGLNRTAYLLMHNYQRDKTGIIDQKGILNSLINNMGNIRDEYLREADYHSQSLEMYHMIRDIIYSYEGTYPPEAIEELYTLTDKIKSSFR